MKVNWSHFIVSIFIMFIALDLYVFEAFNLVQLWLFLGLMISMFNWIADDKGGEDE